MDLRGGCSIVLCILFCWLQFSGAQRERYATSIPKSKQTSVLSLFELTRASKAWSNKVFRTNFDDLTLSEKKGYNKEALKNFTDSGNIATYMNFTEIDAIYLPIPLNFIFVGFDGHGNQDVKLGQEELERWFMNIDNVLEHTRIPQLGEALTPFYRVGADGEQRHHLPLVSYTHYNYSVHAVELPGDVTAVFEYAIKVLSRRENLTDIRSDSEAVWQVDMDSMSYLFESLVHYLQLDDAYNIFILNPRRDNSRKFYGYRRGLSEHELKLVRGDIKLANIKGRKHRHPLDIENFRKPLYDRHPMKRFSWTPSTKTDMAPWIEAYIASLRTVENSLPNKQARDIVYAKAEEILTGSNFALASALRKELKRETEADTGDCLVDAWVGQGRWAFLDITAGPFFWGPTVGGEGVRTSQSFPSIEKQFGPLTISGGVETGEDGIEELQESVQERFATFEGGEDAVDMLLAEVDVYEQFAEKHCRSRKIKISLCQELQERMDDIQTELDSIRSQRHDEAQHKAATEALKRMEKWNMFGDIHEHLQNFSIARDTFLAHVGATLGNAMKHVVTPSTAEGAFHFYDKVSIQLYIITQEKAKHVSLLPVDIAAVKEAISTLALPTQNFHYNVHLVALSEDPALAVAFSVARRAIVLPVLLMNGTYKLSKRNYLDSTILQHQLKQLSAAKRGIAPLVSSATVAPSVSTLEVPIFWFIRSGDPVVIDKHYVAKALPDMVLVVQSGSAVWESHLQCNGQSIIWDPSSPLKHAVAAVGEHLAGIMPTHLTYSHAHDNADEDWSWSVGGHPFSGTSAGYGVSTFQVDAIARSYIVTALDESIQVVNSMAELLSKQHTHAQSFRTFKSREHGLLYEYNGVVGSWKRIASLTRSSRYGEAVRQLPHLRYAVERFKTAVNETVDALHPIHCSEDRYVVVPWDILAGLAVLAVAVLVTLKLLPKRVKPKIN